MSGKKTTTQKTDQQQTATTTLPTWLTDAGQANYGAAQTYFNSPDAVWSADKAAAYANPYQTQVQDRTLASLRDNQGRERAQTLDGIQAAHAYGGTRGAVLEAQQLKDQDSSIMDYLATSNAQGYDAARAAFESDRSARAGGFQTMAQILAAAPRNTTTAGTTTGTTTATQKGSWLDSVLAAGQIAGAVASDRRLKRDIGLIKRLASGIGIYVFRYIWDAATAPLRIGFMADEIERIIPAAVGRVLGFRTVDYGVIGEALP